MNLEFVVAAIGILKSAKAYVPVDPAYPKKRVKWVLDDVAATVVCVSTTQVKHFTSIDSSTEIIIPPTNTPIPTPQPYSIANSGAIHHADHSLMYCIFTSGSTGRPKGVLIEHRNLSNLFGHYRKRWRVHADDSFVSFHSSAFDPSVLEMWFPLLAGGTFMIHLGEWQDNLSRSGATILNLTPSALCTLEPAQVTTRTIFVGGEALF